MASQAIFVYIFLIFSLQFSSIASTNKTSSHMEFLTTLNGVQKGHNAKGIHDLKNYLTYLGYLNHSNHSKYHQTSDVFDTPLESALKKYQKYYHLNVTGILDADTIAYMQKPRCGMPDFYTSHNTASYYSFLPGRPRWRYRYLKYAFDKNVKPKAVRPLQRALRQWASVTPFKFARTRDFEEARIRFSFLRGDHGDGLPFGRPGWPSLEGGLAHCFPPPDGRIHLDAAQKWSYGGDEVGYDVQTVGLHELGHALGLAHSHVKEAIMYSTISSGERKGLHEDDIKGIKRLYKF